MKRNVQVIPWGCAPIKEKQSLEKRSQGKNQECDPNAVTAHQAGRASSDDRWTRRGRACGGGIFSGLHGLPSEARPTGLRRLPSDDIERRVCGCSVRVCPRTSRQRLSVHGVGVRFRC